MSWSFNLDKVNSYAWMDNVFTPEECNQLIKIAKAKKMSDGQLFGNVVDIKVRKNKLVWLDGKDNINWVFEKLTRTVMSLNDEFFNFDLWGLGEDLQFTEYNFPGDHYEKHVDKMYDGIVRKLSVVVQLTDPKKYIGSDLELYNANKPDVMKRDQGAVIVFPSYTLHKVTPIKKGTRHSLVCWVTGKPLK